MGVKFFLTLISLAALCISAAAQENTADYWMKKGYNLNENGSFKFLNRRNESIQSYEKALEILNKTLEKNPQDAFSWQAIGVAYYNLGRQEAAARAYERVIELNY